MTKTTLTASVLAALTLATTATAAQTPATTPAHPWTIAPGGNITAVVNETIAHGWPHAVTQAEIIAVTDLAFWRAVNSARVGEQVSVRCFSGATIARNRCGVVYRTKTTRRAFRLDVRVWEDGAYRMTRKARR